MPGPPAPCQSPYLADRRLPEPQPLPQSELQVSLVAPVQAERRSVDQLEQVIGPERHAELIEAGGRFRRLTGERTIWNVSSTAVGGGVAEMLQVLLGYVRDQEVASRWAVITGAAEFFVITKRLHTQIHGQPEAARSTPMRPAITSRCWRRTPPSCSTR